MTQQKPIRHVRRVRPESLTGKWLAYAVEVELDGVPAHEVLRVEVHDGCWRMRRASLSEEKWVVGPSEVILTHEDLDALLKSNVSVSGIFAILRRD